MRKADLIVPFMLRAQKHFPGPRTVQATQALVKVLGLHRMTVAQIRERIKWFEGEHSSAAIVDSYLVRAILKDRQAAQQAAPLCVSCQEREAVIGAQCETCRGA